jgi:hypothetical protein
VNWLRKLISELRSRRRPSSPSPELREAERIRTWTDDRLGTIKSRTPEILGVADQLKRLGEQNDFAARLRSALGGPGE